MRARGAIRGGAVVALAALVLGAAPGPALASDPDTITLSVAPPTVPAGADVQLSGSIDPAPAAGETVQIVATATGDVVAEATSDGSDSYATSFTPPHSMELRARMGATESDPVTVEVAPRVRAELSGVLLFGTALVRGKVTPALPGGTVKVVLRRGSAVAGRRTVTVDGAGRFRARFPVRRPGRYRAVARHRHADLLPGARATGWKRTPLPRLSAGSRGEVVRLLERRLRALKYYLTGVDRRFDHRTGDAVLAFHKVQGMPRSKRVTRATWRRLAAPRKPQPRARRPAFHIEIDQTRQVLLVIRRGRVAEIVHTSTGAGNATRDGVWRVHRKIAGYSPGRLYYPSYFDGLRAVHGWPSVPAHNASHGCARVPNWTAIHLHRVMKMGTQVRIYH